MEEIDDRIPCCRTEAKQSTAVSVENDASSLEHHTNQPPGDTWSYKANVGKRLYNIRPCQVCDCILSNISREGAWG